MTENEAINELQANIDLPFGFTVSDEVSEMAIKALEEIQQYREIGTIEEFKDLKEKDKDCIVKHLAKECSYNETGCSDCKGKERIRIALEKQVPKKPIEIDEKQDGLFYLLPFMCPACNEPVIGQPYKPKCCKHCGQKLDWEGGE